MLNMQETWGLQGGGQHAVMRVPFYDTAGNRCLFRHRWNDRFDQRDTLLQYKQEIMTNGVIEECRSEIVGLLVPKLSLISHPILLSLGS